MTLTPQKSIGGWQGECKPRISRELILVLWCFLSIISPFWRWQMWVHTLLLSPLSRTKSLEIERRDAFLSFYGAPQCAPLSLLTRLIATKVAPRHAAPDAPVPYSMTSSARAGPYALSIASLVSCSFLIDQPRISSPLTGRMKALASVRGCWSPFSARMKEARRRRLSNLDDVEIGRVLQQLSLDHIIEGNAVTGIGRDDRMPIHVV